MARDGSGSNTGTAVRLRSKKQYQDFGAKQRESFRDHSRLPIRVPPCSSVVSFLFTPIGRSAFRFCGGPLRSTRTRLSALGAQNFLRHSPPRIHSVCPASERLSLCVMFLPFCFSWPHSPGAPSRIRIPP